MLFSPSANKNRRAFSLLEVSVTIIIIGILLVAVIGSKQMIKKSRILSAQSETRSSPIISIPDNKLWLESSLDDESFGEGLSTGDAITSWSDASLTKDKTTITLEGTGPTYSNSINHVQAVKFDSTSATNHLKIVNPEFLNNTDYTIIILENKLSQNTGGGNYLLGTSGSFSIGYESETSIIQSNDGSVSGDNQASVEATYSNKPRMLVFTHTSATGNKFYVNGTLANEDSSDEAKAHLADLSTAAPLKIGKNYNGEIGELVIFDRNLKNTERKDIEDYLSDKWKSPNNRILTPSCTLGTVTNSGCDASCPAPSINGVTSIATLADTASSTYNCDATGYTPSVTPLYSCVGGSLTPTPLQTDCSDNGCETGYDLNSTTGACDMKCTLGAQTGLATAIKVASGSVSQACDSGYAGFITYTCGGGTIASVVNDCIIACDLDAENIPGITQTGTVLEGSATLTCNDTGFVTADINYTCDSSGEFVGLGTCLCDSPSYLPDSSSNCVDANMLAWFDGADVSTITHASNAVSNWADKTGNGYDVSTSDTNRQPTFTSNAINSLSALTFNSDYLGRSGPILTNSASNLAIMIVSKTTTAYHRTIYSQAVEGTGWGANHMVSFDSSGNISYVNYPGTGSSAAGGPGANELSLVTINRSGTTNSYYKNGVLLGTGAANTYTRDVDKTSIGRRTDAGGREYFNGEIAEVILFERTLTDGEREAMETYLIDKWGI